jgi:formylglycine-generating enzyme required for sulfatase activity
MWCVWLFGLVALVGEVFTPLSLLADSPSSDTYAVVIGIGHYREEVIPKVPYAVQDAHAIASIFEGQSGIQRDHIRLLTNSHATGNDLRTIGDWLSRRVNPDSTVYIYYAGHGTPDPKTGEPYLVPWDGHPDYPAGLFPLKDFYQSLDRLPAKSVIVFLDSCFSGTAGRSVIATGSRPMALKAEYPWLISGKIVVFAAATGSQISSDYDNAGHGLFTHYVISGLQGHADMDKDGVITLKELFPYVRDHVAHTAVKELDREQTPRLLPGEDLIDQGFSHRLTIVAKAPAYGDPEVLQREIMGQDGLPMLLIPASEFTMGSNDGENDEKPPHQVYLDAFYIDKFEVTTPSYAKFIEAAGGVLPKFWEGVMPGGEGDRPVVGIDWNNAAAYCQWVGKRLPTEAEWEKAARGFDGRIYPWGHESPTKLNANFAKTNWKGYSTLVPVGKLEGGKSPYGIYDMAGNVYEWVADWYDKDFYRSSPDRNPTGPKSGQFKVLRGGSWSVNAFSLRSTARTYFTPTHRYNFIGFRCAKTP